MSTFLMKIFRSVLRRVLTLLPFLFFAVACSPRPTPTPFRPPTPVPPTQILPTTTPIPAMSTSTALASPTFAGTATEGPCINSLAFIDDVTVEDDSPFAPGVSIDKQWLVENNGTCDWDSTYALKWVGGTPLGAAETQVLYPARAGTQATLRILFTSPLEAGSYESWWQATDSAGNLFGDEVYMSIVVNP